MNHRVSRRKVLKGAGVALTLPWLESVAFGAGEERLKEPPLRTAFLFLPNGVLPNHWTPPGEAEEFEITPHLKPVAEFKNDFLLIENLWNRNSIGRNGHWPKVPIWLSGGYVQRTTGDDLDTGAVSVDQFAAQKIGTQTRLPSLELGLDAPRTGIDVAGGGFARLYGSFISWRDGKTPVPKEIVPQLAFDRLFRSNHAPVVSSVNPKDPSLLKSLQRDDTSVLDVVMDSANTLRRNGSASDRVRLDEYFESIRNIEQRIEATMRPQKRWINSGQFPLDRPAPGIPQSRQEHMRLMLDILALAFWSDATRIGSVMLGDAQSNYDYSFLDGVHGGFHSLSHHGNENNTVAQYCSIVDWHMEQVAYFLRRLKSLDEGGKSLLDNSMIMVGDSLKDGNSHAVEDLPIMIAGRGKGTLRPGRRVRAPEHTPLCNLYVEMLNRMGVKTESFGDSTGGLQGLA